MLTVRAIMTWRSILGVVAAATVLSFACGGGRKSAATQKTPTAFDPAQSDAKAVAAVDGMLAALGGAPAWDKAKQISWELKYTLDGDMKFWFRHHWDRWNGRHRFEVVDMNTHKAAVSANDDKLRKWRVAMYDLFDTEARRYAEYGGKPIARDDVKKFVVFALTHWKQNHYQLAFHYKVKDPGVILKHVGEYKEKDGLCKPTCDTIKVTFASGVGEDTYYININSESKLPEFIEKQSPKGRIGFLLQDWQTVSGMKFPGKLQNMGLKGEIWSITNIKIADPDDFLFVPRARY